MGWIPCSGTSNFKKKIKEKLEKIQVQVMGDSIKPTSGKLKRDSSTNSKDSSKNGYPDHIAAKTFSFRELATATRMKQLDWNTRMKIAAGAARGLEFLHDKATPPVIYRNLKSFNILLDEGYHAKLSDFGLAKLGPVGENTHVSTFNKGYRYLWILCSRVRNDRSTDSQIRYLQLWRSSSGNTYRKESDRQFKICSRAESCRV